MGVASQAGRKSSTTNCKKKTKERTPLVSLQNYAKQIRVEIKGRPVAQFIRVNLIIVPTHRQSSL